MSGISRYCDFLILMAHPREPPVVCAVDFPSRAYEEADYKFAVSNASLFVMLGICIEIWQLSMLFCAQGSVISSRRQNSSLLQ